MKLSILILSLTKRLHHLTNLLAILKPQLIENEVELILEIDEGQQTIGEKRNSAMKRATGDYVCYIDDDDEVANNYVELILNAIKNDPDCCSLTGVYTVDGKNHETFKHSILYSEWRTNTHPNAEVKYERYPNHLNVIRKSIAEKYSFAPVNHGEDQDWSTRINKDRVLIQEAQIGECIYYYKYVSNK